MLREDEVSTVPLHAGELASYRDLFTQMALADLKWAQTRELWRLRAEADQRAALMAEEPTCAIPVESMRAMIERRP
jgi:hypothetical protein